MDHGGGIRYDQYIDCSERCIDTRYLQCGFHGRRRDLHIYTGKYPHVEQDLVARMDRNRQYIDSE